MHLPLRHQLPTGHWVELATMLPEEAESVRSLLNTIIEEGTSYPQSYPLSPSEFAEYWLKGQAYVVKPWDPAIALSPAASSEIWGAFYIKPNFPGRCSHICNAGFIVPPAHRGQGLGRWMGTQALPLAKSLGYEAMMFNLVFATNTPSLAIWASLGFQELTRIPAAVHLPDGTTTEAVMLYRSLLDY